MADDKEASNVKISNYVPLREQLVNKAVDFLLNPGIQKGDDQSKIQFLKKKGLTEQEIDAAFEKARLDSKLFHSIDTSKQVNGIYPGPLPSHYVAPSIWSQLSNVSSPFIVLGVALYGLHHFYQKYLKPWFLGKDDSDSLADHIKALTNNIAVLTDTVSKLNVSVAKQNEDVNRLIQLEGSSYAPTPVILEDLKREVNALKSILISRHQFPATPQLQSTKPTIPPWQLPASDGSSPKSEIHSDSHEQDTKETYENINAEAQSTESEVENSSIMNGTIKDTAENIKRTTTTQANCKSINGDLKSEISKMLSENSKKVIDNSSSIIEEETENRNN